MHTRRLLSSSSSSVYSSSSVLLRLSVFVAISVNCFVDVVESISTDTYYVGEGGEVLLPCDYEGENSILVSVSTNGRFCLLSPFIELSFSVLSPSSGIYWVLEGLPGLIRGPFSSSSSPRLSTGSWKASVLIRRPFQFLTIYP